MPRFIGYALALFVVISLTLTTPTAQSNKTTSVRDPGSVMPENKVPGTIERPLDASCISSRRKAMRRPRLREALYRSGLRLRPTRS